MFVGHALLAFALVGVTAAHFRDRQTALRLGLLAAAFATVPDVDMSYALAGLFGADGGAISHASAFWQASTLVHRGVTHSLVVAPVVAALAAVWVAARRSDRHATSRIVACAVAVFVLAFTSLAALVSGVLGGLVVATFVVAAVGVAELGVRRTAASGREVFLVALAGLASHPFGDLFTGEPPALLYPLDAVVVERVTLAADPTLHLLGAFAVELAAIWAGVLVAARLLGRSPRTMVDTRAVVGVGYAAAVLFIPAPTLELSYPFVFSVLAVGTVGLVPRLRRPDWRFERPDVLGAVVTGLGAVTTAALAYGLAYASMF